MGGELLKGGASALEVVETVIAQLEESGHFNAGSGSALNIIGKVEMDAGIMDGATMRAGSVTGVSRVRHPISLARRVMDYTDHVIMSGEWAEKLAETTGIEVAKPVMLPSKLREYYNYKKMFMEGIYKLPKNVGFFRKYHDMFEVIETVGAVALDDEGKLAAGSSSGGLWLKFPGRVGASAIPGAAFYADDSAAAVASGLGEYLIVTNLCFRVVDLIARGYSPQRSAERVIQVISRLAGEGTAGVLALNRHGEFGIAYNTKAMLRGIFCDRLRKPVIEF